MLKSDKANKERELEVALPTKRFQRSDGGHIIAVIQSVLKPVNCLRCSTPIFMVYRLESGPPSERRGVGGPG